MTIKGVLKLVSQPKQFLKDYAKKSKNSKGYLQGFIRNKQKKYFPKKVFGEDKYTVVSAVYGVESYLDDYFKSLVNQTLDFKQHIYLVMVDDGSLDDSAQIIKKWQEKYPNNITYVKKENGGQASARNLGLEYVETEWVTFIDPDDFIEQSYFEVIDTFKANHSDKEFAMLACNLHFYYEKGKRFVNNHPLKYKFSKDENIVTVADMKNNIQLAVHSALFKTTIINNYQIKFKDIKPNFEDAHFVNSYLLKLSNKSELNIAFLKQSIYFYRKRADETSALDTTWYKKEQFKDVLLDGCLDLLQLSEDKPPEYIQRVVLYHLIWYFKYLINREERLSLLNDEEKKVFLSLVKEIFNDIDTKTIHEFNLAGCWFYHKVGLIGMMKEERLLSQIVYVDEYDELKKLVKLRYFSYFESSSIVTLDNREVLPLYSKIIRHTFVGEKFVDEYILWVPIEANGKLDIFVDNLPTRLSFRGKHYPHGVNSSDILSYFENSKKVNSANFPLRIKIARKIFQLSYFKKRFKEAWILMDRDTQADDNAEHLYRYIQKNYPQINIFFILRKDSHDWERLKNDGFKLIAFGSVAHKASLTQADHMIASDASKIQSDYLNKKYYKDLLHYKFTFLQHGITKNDLSAWLNTKKIDCFVTAVEREYASIVDDFNHYKFSKREVVLTGFPRHDLLIEGNSLKSKTLLIMPTWRNNLTDKAFEGTIGEQEYFVEWSKFLNSESLKKVVLERSYSVIFNSHPNMKDFIEYLNIPKYIEFYKGKESIQKLFQNSDLLITDYSSVALEMGLLNKPTLYYQFDHQTFFSGGHSYTKGYYDYEEDGFGSVCYTYEALIDELDKYLSGDLAKKFYKRMEEFYLYKDKNNAQRVFNAIEDLYVPRRDEIDDLKLKEYLEKRYDDREWKSVESISEKLLEQKFDKNIKLKWVEAKIELGKGEEAEVALASFENHSQYDSLMKRLNFIKALLESLTINEQKRLIDESRKVDFFVSLKFENLKRFFADKDFKVLLVAFELFDEEKLEEEQKSEFYYMWGRTLRLTNRKEESLEKLSKSLSYNDRLPNSALWEYSSTLFEVYEHQIISSDTILNLFKDNNYTVENIEYILLKNWFDKKYYKQVLVAFELFNQEKLEEEQKSEFYYMWGRTLFSMNRYDEVIKVLSKIKNESLDILIIKGKSYLNLKKWKDSLELWEDVYKKYPQYNKEEVLKYIILSLTYLEKKDKLATYKEYLSVHKILNSDESILDILNYIKEK